MRKSFIIVILNVFLMGIGNLSFANLQALKNGLFEIDVPQGWNLDDQSSNIRIEGPGKRSFTMITVGPASAGDDEAKGKKILKEINERTIAALKAGFKFQSATTVKILGEKEIRVDGVYARRLEYNLTDKDQRTSLTTNVCLIYKGHVITFTFLTQRINGQDGGIIDPLISSVVFKR